MSRLLVVAAVAIALCVQLAGASTQQNPIPLTLAQPLSGTLTTATQITCYVLTLDDPTVRQVVFWNAGKLLIRMEPCQARPHMTVSVYGCPSTTKTVYEFMSAKMVADAIANGQSSSIPPSWEWPGDVELLTIDITHKTYYIEVQNLGPPTVSTQVVPSSYTLLTNIFDANSTSSSVPNSKEQLYPLTYLSSSSWDRTVIRDNSSDSANSFSFGGGSTASLVTIDFYPPGLPYASNPASIIASNVYQFSVFIKEITNQIGTSQSGPFVNIVPNYCPPAPDCTTGSCRSCSTSYPNCPKEFLTDCSETTLNVATLKTDMANLTTPFDAYAKDPTQWTAWTVCGANQTMDRIDGSLSYVVLGSARATTPLVWLNQGSLNVQSNSANQLQITIQGLSSDNNNVYLVNVIVRPISAATSTSTPVAASAANTITNTTETTIYQFMTLQMRTPRYETPTLTNTDYAIIIGVSCGLGACIIIFVGVAILVRHKRKQKLAQRIRMKK